MPRIVANKITKTDFLQERHLLIFLKIIVVILFTDVYFNDINQNLSLNSILKLQIQMQIIYLQNK